MNLGRTRTILTAILLVLSSTIFMATIIFSAASYVACVFCGHRTVARTVSPTNERQWLDENTHTQASGVFFFEGVVAIGTLDQTERRKLASSQGRFVISPSSSRTSGGAICFTADRVPTLSSRERPGSIWELGTLQTFNANTTRLRMHAWLLIVAAMLFWLWTLYCVVMRLRRTRESVAPAK